jgi:hypothetical protein
MSKNLPAKSLQIETDFALLLTASVDPKGMPGITQTDPVEREATYADCLRFYLQNDPRVRRIIFAENSGWPLNRFHEEVAANNPHAKEVELLSFNCNDYPRERGKSYGELILMKNAIGASRLAGLSRYIGKMTGRNLLFNLTELLDCVTRDFELLCDIRDHNFYQLLRMPDCGHHCDSRFFVFTREFFDRHLVPICDGETLASGYPIESILFDLVKRLEKTEPIIKRFRVEPEYAGAAGHFIRNKAKDYSSTSEMVKRRIRSASRRVTPWLHI